jgi:cytochrome c oxidase subunit II
MHIDLYEKWWMGISIVVLLVFSTAIGVAGFALGIQVPQPEERINPTTVDQHPEFGNPGLRELSPGKYRAYVVAKASPWRFYPDKMTVPAGASVEFHVVSGDVQHGFEIPQNNVNVMVVPGQISKVTHTFDKAGKYPYICTEYCGVGHQNMYGTLTVEEAKK